MEDKKDGFEVRKINKYFGRFRVLSDINLKLGAGEFLTIFGANGAGKTTLLRVFAGLLKQDSGNIYIDGIDADNEPEKLRKSIGFISHNTFLYNDLTAYENLRFFGQLYDIEEYESQIENVLNRVGLQKRASEPVRNFSRGMQQRLAIARAFLHNPSLLLLDEPYTGLDQRASAVLNQILEGVHKENKNAVITTHDINQGLEIADKVAVIDRGCIVYNESKEALNTDNFKDLYIKIVSSE